MRTVREELEVSEKIDAEIAIYPRLDDAWEALKWWLARKPQNGQLLDDYHWLYKQQGSRDLNVPALVVIYTFNASQVDILALLVRLPTL